MGNIAVYAGLSAIWANIYIYIYIYIIIYNISPMERSSGNGYRRGVSRVVGHLGLQGFRV
jgi:hypothetical protein